MPNLIQLIRELKWQRVIDLCERDPSAAKNKDADGALALHVACRIGAPLYVLRRIREAYPEAVRRKDQFGNLPLHRACRARAPQDVVRYLCGPSGEGIRTPDVDGWIPLHIAVRYGGALETVRYLHGLYEKGIKAKTKGFGFTPLHAACLAGSSASLDVIRYLVSEDPGGLNEKDLEGMTPFEQVWASDRSNSEKELIIAILIGGEESPAVGRSAQAQGGHVVARRSRPGDEDKQRYAAHGPALMQERSSSTRSMSPRLSSSLYPSFTEGTVSMFQLIEAEHWDEVKRQCRWPTPREGRSRNAMGDLPIHAVCRQNAPSSVVRSILDSSGREAAQSKSGRGADLPLHLSCAAGADLETIQLLNESFRDGARIPNQAGRLPLHISAHKGAPLNTVLYLCGAYDDAVRVVDHAGDLPLHCACKGSAPTEVVRYLARAYPEALSRENKLRQTPIHCIESSSRADKAEVLPDLKAYLDGSEGVAERRIANVKKGRRSISKVLEIDMKSPPVPVPLEYLEECTDDFSGGRRLGDGAFGVVFRADDKVLRRAFAVKRIRCQFLANSGQIEAEDARKAFRRELEVLSHFRHPNIARLWAYFMPDEISDEHCLVYELASNGSLASFLNDDSGRKRLSWKVRMSIALDVAKAVRYLHTGASGYICYHRDVKSANVVLKKDFTALLTDCGLSKMLPGDDSRLGLSIMSSSKGAVLGTAGYWCPEYALTGTDFSSASEVFSLGIVFIELLTGQLQNSKLSNGRRINFFVKYRDRNRIKMIEKDVDKCAGVWDKAAKEAFTAVALKSIAANPKKRPKIGAIVENLEALVIEHNQEESNCLVAETTGSKGSCLCCMRQTATGSLCTNASSPHFICSICFRKNVEDHLGDDVILCPVESCQSNYTEERILQSTSLSLLSRHLDAKYHKKYTALEERNISGSNHITVLFSAPLAYRDESNKFHPIERLNFDREEQLLLRCFQEASRAIQIAFDNATIERLQVAVTNCCSVLHYSGHGYPSFLVLEDGKGGVHWLGIDELSSLVISTKGGAPFSTVFVSACDSEMIGQTFIDAGVPHVVCCQHGSQLEDAAACEFTRAFYHALALGRTVQESFDAGRQAVNLAPTVKGSSEEMKKFVLLPKGGDHKVAVLDAPVVSEWSQQKYVLHSCNNSLQQQPLPSPPEVFLGRDVDMYHILNAVLTRRFVSIIGQGGIGKRSLAAALCHYINERKRTITQIEVIFFVQNCRGRSCSNSIIQDTYEQISSACDGEVPQFLEKDLDTATKTILKLVGATRALFVFDITGLSSYRQFSFFVGSLLQGTKQSRVLLVARHPLGHLTPKSCGEHIYRLGPLNFESSAKLFGRLHPDGCRNYSGLRESASSSTLAKNDVSRDGSITWKQDDEIFPLLREGVPSKIFSAARKMSLEDL